MSQIQHIKKVSKIIVDLIILDLEDTKGLNDEWDQINDDIQEEIKHKWADLAHRVMVTQLL